MQNALRQPLRCIAGGLAAAAVSAAVTPAAGQTPDPRTITLPAIAFTGEGGGSVSKTETPGANARAFVYAWYTPGHWLEWEVAGLEAGEYQVRIRHAGRFTVQRGLAVNGRPVPGQEIVTLAATGRDQLKGGWEQWGETTLAAPVTLTAGRNVLRLTCLDEASVRLGEIELLSPGREPVTIPATSFTGQAGGQVRVRQPPVLGRIGSVWAQPWMNAGHWLEWTVTAPAAGRYAVGLHFAADGYCRLELQVNGGIVPGLEDFILPRSGGGDLYNVGTLPVPVELREGENTLRMTTLGGPGRGVPRFDGRMSLSAIHLAPLAAGALPQGNVLVLQKMEQLVAAVKEPEPVPPAPLGPPLPAVAGAVPLEEGRAFELGGRRAVVAKADVLPYVANDFTGRCIWESFDSPRLREIREKFRLDEVVAAGKDEYEKQELLMKWLWELWDHGHAQELYNLKDPAWILREAHREHIFQCMHSGSALMTVMASMGWVCRLAGHSSHTWNEVWSNQHRKWVFFDPTSNLRYVRKDVPLSTYEYYHARHVEGADDIQAFSRANSRWAVRPDPGKTARVSVSGMNTWELGGRQAPRFRMEIGGATAAPFDPAVIHHPINQAALALVPEGAAVRVTLGTMTPNFQEFRVRLDGGEWRTTEPVFVWTPRDGENRLEAVSVNRFGVEGPVSTVVLRVEKP